MDGLDRPSFEIRDVEPINFHFYSSLRISIAAHFRSGTAKSAIYLVEFYVNGLVVEWNRIAESISASNKLMLGGAAASNDEAARILVQVQHRFILDTHFYLICWDKIEKHLSLFERAQGSPEVSAIRARIENLLSKGALARHFLEHLDKQVTEGKIGIKSAAVTGTGGFTFTYEDESKKGRKIERVVTLGRAEVLQVANAYIDILSSLGVPEEKLQPRPQ